MPLIPIAPGERKLWVGLNEVCVSRLLAPLHGVDYVTPAMVNLAARKVFRHRIIVARAEDDRSLQYGSEIYSVEQLLAHATPDTILDDVTVQVDAPL